MKPKNNRSLHILSPIFTIIKEPQTAVRNTIRSSNGFLYGDNHIEQKDFIKEKMKQNLRKKLQTLSISPSHNAKNLSFASVWPGKKNQSVCQNEKSPPCALSILHRRNRSSQIVDKLCKIQEKMSRFKSHKFNMIEQKAYNYNPGKYHLKCMSPTNLMKHLEKQSKMKTLPQAQRTPKTYSRVKDQLFIKRKAKLSNNKKKTDPKKSITTTKSGLAPWDQQLQSAKYRQYLEEQIDCLTK